MTFTARVFFDGHYDNVVVLDAAGEWTSEKVPNGIYQMVPVELDDAIQEVEDDG